MIDVCRVFTSIVLSASLGVISSYASATEQPLAEAKEKAGTKEEKPANKKVIGDPIVAKIGASKVIRRSEVLRTVQDLPAATRQQMSEDKIFKAVLDRLVRSYLLTEAAKKAGIEKDPTFQKALEANKSELLSRFFLMQEVQVKLTKAALEARYKRFVTEFPKELEHHLFHILVKDEATAKAVITDLERGGNFDALARDKSIAPSREKSGDEGYVMKSMLPPQFSDELGKLKQGEFTKTPIKTDMGYHVIKVTDARDAVPPKLEEIQQALQSLLFQEEALKLVKKLESQKKVERFNEDGTPVAEESKAK
ncbi:MAG: peptidyl-prolyl cis-trans isomerase [Holosporales bacterium]|jgi:peptidyl-prolyl cis-trans isomerase C|nr:peptidyl-prolyl cis-trans isomerase [Holosporales bacterium]